MAKLLAIEWDGREARVVLANSRPNSVTIEQAFAVELGPRDAGETFADESVGEQIGRELQSRGIRQTDALVAIGRANILLRVINVPPAPADELPEMVRFQAMRQFTTVEEDWPLDFITLDETEDGVSVLASAIAPEMVSQVRQTCGAGGLTARSMVLRPVAAASLLGQSDQAVGCQLMVDLLGDEVDLTIAVEGKVSFMRTVRRPSGGEDTETQRSMIAEIRRTMMAAHNQLGGRQVDGVVIYGKADDHAALKEQLEQELSLAVQMLNPFECVEVASGLRNKMPEHTGRYAPLLGMLASESSGSAHTIDFLNPRRGEVATTDNTRNLLIGAAAAVVVLGLVGTLWFFWASQQRQLNDYANTHQGLLKDEKKYQAAINEIEEIDQWVDGDINWLDEVRAMSEEFPAADKAIVTTLSAKSLSEGGQVMLNCEMADSSLIHKTAEAIRDDRHEVIPKNPRATKEDGQFASQVTLMVNVTPIFDVLTSAGSAKQDGANTDPSADAVDENSDDKPAEEDAAARKEPQP